MKMPSSVLELLHAARKTHTDMAKIIGTFFYIFVANLRKRMREIKYVNKFVNDVTFCILFNNDFQ
jgi:hypothetical protein